MVIAATLLAVALATAPATGISVPDILEVTDISGLSSSPDGRWIAFRSERPSVALNGYHQTWYVVPSDGSAPPRPVADGGDALFTDAGTLASQTPVWAPSSSAIYVRALVDGEVQVWRGPTDGSGATIITHDPANVRDLALSPDGLSLVYHVAATRDAIDEAEQSAHDDGVLIDASVDPSQPISRGSFVNGKPASERLTGSWFDHGDILWRTPLVATTIPLPRLDFGDPAQASRQAEQARISSSAGKTTLAVSIAGGAELICQTRKCRTGHVDSAVPLDDGKSYLVTTSDLAHAQTVSLWRPGATKARILAASTGFLNGDRYDDGAPCAVARHTAACIEATPAIPPRLVLIDTHDGKRHVVFDPNALLRTRIMDPIRTLRWHGKNGTAFAGQLILPATPAPPTGFPLVINYYYCSGFLRGGLGEELPMLPLAAHGVATLCINRARSSDANPTRAWEYATAEDGIGSIVKQLAGEGLVDRKRIGMSGLSFGSEIVTDVAEHTNLLAAAAISTTQQEPAFYWFNTVAGRDTAASMKAWWQVGDPDNDRIGWKAISPALNVETVHVPLLMQLPEGEMRLSMEFYSKLSRSPTPVELYAFANETHVKHEPRHQRAVYDRNLDWFRFWLTGEIDNAPGKSGQYKRWRDFASRPGYELPAAAAATQSSASTRSRMRE